MAVQMENGVQNVVHNVVLQEIRKPDSVVSVWNKKENGIINYTIQECLN